jgi:Ni/Co efflux regulator RcnB
MKSSLPRLLACVLVFACAAPPAQGQQTAPAQQQQQSQQQQSQQQQSQQPQPPSQQQAPAQSPPQHAADADEVLQVNTRVVFLDALVTDKKTRALAQDLKAENFEVAADGQRREVTYFSREGDAARRPLALTLVFDLRRNGAGRYLRRTEILEAMANELSKLPPADEVAVVALDTGTFGERREWLTPFTRNRAQTASALAVVPSLVGEGSSLGDASPLGGPSPSPAPSASPAPAPAAGVGADEKAAREREEKREQERKGEADGVSVTIGSDGGGFSSMTMMASTRDELESVYEDLNKKHGRPGEPDEVDRFVDSKGREAKRTLKPDGTLLVERQKKDGTYEVNVYNDSNLPGAVFEVSKRLQRERPNSQGAIVYITDGIALMAYPERDYVEHKMLRQNFIFSALVTDMKTGFKLAKPLLSPLGNLIGLNIYGGAQHIARQTGGEAVRVSRPTDYATGLARIVGNLSARYSLGFTLAEGEPDDNRLHQLTVRARARDAKGKERKLEVKTRTGYFMPVTKSAKPPADTAKKSDADGPQAERVKN